MSLISLLCSYNDDQQINNKKSLYWKCKFEGLMEKKFLLVYYCYAGENTEIM